MKTPLLFAGAIRVLRACCVTACAHFALDWQKVASGGGTSIGGVYQ